MTNIERLIYGFRVHNIIANFEVFVTAAGRNHYHGSVMANVGLRSVMQNVAIQFVIWTGFVRRKRPLLWNFDVC